MKSSFNLGKIMGIPFMINYSWFLIFFFIAFILAQYYFPERYPDWSTPVAWVAGVGTSLLFFASVVFHELAHSWVAVRSGIPIRSITLFFLGGMATITREASRPNTELLMAFAGPLSSLVLAGLFALIWLASRNAVEVVGAMSYYLCWINVALAVFNLIPGFPMDGGRVLRSIIWWRNGNYMRATRLAARAGQVLGYAAVLAGLVVIFTVNLITGLWAIIIGLFLSVAASTSYRQEMLRETLRNLTAEGMMAHDYRRVPEEVTVEAALKYYFTSDRDCCLLVEKWDEPVGILTRKNAGRVPKKHRQTTTVAEAMIPLEEVRVVSPGDDGLIILEKIEEGDTGLVLVKAEDRIVGIIDRDRLIDVGFDRSEARA